MVAALDSPTGETSADPLCLRVTGWVFGKERHSCLVGIEVDADGVLSGRTDLVFSREDVNVALGLDPTLRCGFDLLIAAPELFGRSRVVLTISAVWRDGTRSPVLSRTIPLLTKDYRREDWGVLVDPGFPHLVRREHMFNSGPAQEAASPDLINLLNRYLPPPPLTVLDVGCGRGSYALPLRASGYNWFGVEVRPEYCEFLNRKGLPNRLVDGNTLPFGSATFDSAIAVEVLEHVKDPWTFIADVRRVVRDRLIVSVPNAELITYWRSRLAIPWHMLEPDHHNFFSRASLREVLRKEFRTVEIVGYGEAPIKTAEGARLDYHLLAVAAT